MFELGLLPKYFSFGFRFPAYGGDLPLAEKRVRLLLGIVHREAVVVYRLRTKDETDIQTDTWPKIKTNKRLVPQSAGRINRLEQQPQYLHHHQFLKKCLTNKNHVPN
jgi:hypothetical protein